MLGGREKWSFSVFCHIGGPESGPGSLNWWSSRLQARWQHCRAAYLVSKNVAGCIFFAVLEVMDPPVYIYVHVTMIVLKRISKNWYRIRFEISDPHFKY